jgi:hypothetical protein
MINETKLYKLTPMIFLIISNSIYMLNKLVDITSNFMTYSRVNFNSDNC